MALTRIAGPDDAETLMRLINTAFLVERFFIDEERVALADVLEFMAKGVFLVAGDMEACVYTELRGERAYLGLLSVAPSKQGSGLGRKMVEAAERYCREHGCEWMDLRVVDVREELPPFYRKLGYAECGTEPFPPDVETKIPISLIKMQKKLSAPAAAGTDSC